MKTLFRLLLAISLKLFRRMRITSKSTVFKNNFKGKKNHNKSSQNNKIHTKKAHPLVGKTCPKRFHQLFYIEKILVETKVLYTILYIENIY